MWQYCSGGKNGYKSVYSMIPIISKGISYIEVYTGDKVVNDGYFWVVILSVFFLFYVLLLSQVFYSNCVLFYNTGKYRLLKIPLMH